MKEPVRVGGLTVEKCLYELVSHDIAPGTNIDPDAFWASLEAIVRDLEPKHRALLDKRDALQAKIDAWHLDRKNQPIDLATYKAFLTEIGYLVPEGDDFRITTENVDPEIATFAGPQLVVPIDNARYALNAANARWGSLYDALYGTDVIPETNGAEKGTGYNPVRGARVVEWAARFLDQAVGLAVGSYAEVVQLTLTEAHGRRQLVITLNDGRQTSLADPSQLVGFTEANGELSGILLRNHNLHIEIQFDRNHPIGKVHPAGIKDVVLEAALTTIQDCEDSVTAVDAEDKTQLYRNWLGIMKGTLETTFGKGDHKITRSLNPDRPYTGPDGQMFTLPGRSLLLVRNVGIHMYTDAVTTASGDEIPEGFLDAMIMSFAGRGT
ncbi:MAG: hypothetical protein HC808_03745 [Candidatus Competibacteraceae bacterium]|nr:hypothetical protein [Candidatus Competibacteraceae bacterium]